MTTNQVKLYEPIQLGRSKTAAYSRFSLINKEKGILPSSTLALGGIFGGDGSNGPLLITSGTTTLDVDTVALYVRNYSSISIVGTGALAFSDPNTSGTIIILKSIGDVNITSTATSAINVNEMGGAGGAGVVAGAGNDGSTGRGNVFQADFGNGALVGTGGVAGTRIEDNNASQVVAALSTGNYRQLVVSCGAGGGGSTAITGVTATNGTRGGGALIIECGGRLNFTGTLTGRGGNAGTCTTDVSSPGGAGGGGSIYIIYNRLLANAGTITVTGGSNTTCNTGNANTCGGGGGASLINSGGAGGCGASGAGGAGGAGFSAVISNDYFS